MTPPRRPWPLRVFALLAVLLLGVTACGGEDEPEPAATTPGGQDGQAQATELAEEQAAAVLAQLDAQRAALEAQIPELPEPCQPFAELNLAVTDLLRASVAESDPAAFDEAFADLDQALADVVEVAPDGREVLTTARERLEGDQQALADADYDLAALEGREDSAFSALDDFDPSWVPDECAQAAGPDAPAEEGGTDGDGAATPPATETPTDGES